MSNTTGRRTAFPLPPGVELEQMVEELLQHWKQFARAPFLMHIMHEAGDDELLALTLIAILGTMAEVRQADTEDRRTVTVPVERMTALLEFLARSTPAPTAETVRRVLQGAPMSDATRAEFRRGQAEGLAAVHAGRPPAPDTPDTSDTPDVPSQTRPAALADDAPDAPGDDALPERASDRDATARDLALVQELLQSLRSPTK